MRLWEWLVGAPFVSWTAQIQALKTDKPLPLPAVKALVGKLVVPPKSNVAQFTKRFL